MVEGPKVSKKASKLAVVMSQKVVDLTKETKLPRDVIDRSISRILAVGKELFLVLDSGSAIRLHFGMNGSERIMNNATLATLDIPALLPKHSRMVFAGAIELTYCVLVFFDTTMQLKLPIYIEIAEQRLPRDVMSASFSVDAVVELLRQDTRDVMESVMDQKLLPGVGNVIKCEALFNSGIHPNTKTHLLADDKLLQLVEHLRDFSREWFVCSMKRRDIDKSIYGRSSCRRCGAAVCLIRAGQMQRITYYCSKCQSSCSSAAGAAGAAAAGAAAADAADAAAASAAAGADAAGAVGAAATTATEAAGVEDFDDKENMFVSTHQLVIIITFTMTIITIIPFFSLSFFAIIFTSFIFIILVIIFIVLISTPSIASRSSLNN
jgi:formamidopyrimidine-DNA glycosylase